MNKILIIIKLICTGLIAGALAYWFNTCGKEHLFGVQIQLIMVFTTFLGACISRVFLNEDAWLISILISAGVMTAVIGRISFDLAYCPNSHNLLPLEVLFNFILVVSSAFAGSNSPRLFNTMKLK